MSIVPTPSLTDASCAAAGAVPPPASPGRQRQREALARRAAAQAPGPLREALLARLERLDHLEPAPPAQRGTVAPATPGAAPASALAGLLAELRALQAAGGGELRQVQQHQRAWGALRVQRRLAEVMAPVSEQLGPLNNQVLVRRALQQMQALSPDYLQAFIAQVDGLAALAPLAVAEPAPSRRERGR